MRPHLKKHDLAIPLIPKHNYHPRFGDKKVNESDPTVGKYCSKEYPKTKTFYGWSNLKNPWGLITRFSQQLPVPFSSEKVRFEF